MRKADQAISNIFGMVHVMLRAVDSPFRKAADCMLGKNHPHARLVRLLVGAAFMGVGVAVSHIGGEFHGAISMTADALGYALHGMGLTPWLEVLTDALDDGKLDP